MGSYDIACSVSNITIHCGDPIVYLPLEVYQYRNGIPSDFNNILIGSYCFYLPATLPIYGIYDDHKNQSGRGVKKTHIHSKYDLDDILAGKYEKYSKKMLKKRLIDNGYLQEECSMCGWNEMRLIDDKICITLDFVDGNESNFSLENLRLLCSNCYFTNVGNFKNSQIFCTK